MNQPRAFQAFGVGGRIAHHHFPEGDEQRPVVRYLVFHNIEWL
jgi:hypothetical protein